jgi:hypothetical protein
MKKICLYSIAMLLFTSCSKSLKNENDLQSEVLQGASLSQASVPGCNVAKITYLTSVDTPGIAKFYYNLKGDPTMILFNSVGTDRGGHLEFRYDLKHRLSDYISPMSTDPNTSYYFWYTYAYDSKNRVLVDTGYLFGAIVNNIPQPNEVYKSSGNYEYDTQGRITRITRRYFQNGNFIFETVYNYAYDPKGNLVGFGPYDDQLNIHRTSKVLQFVDRNYSVNNPATAVKYNSFGYPLQFNTLNEITFAFRIDLRQSVIEYQCHE